MQGELCKGSSEAVQHSILHRVNSVGACGQLDKSGSRQRRKHQLILMPT